MIKKIIKDTLALVVISFVSVILLAVVYEITKDPIDNAVKNEIVASYEKVFPNTIIKEESLISEPVDIVYSKDNSVKVSISDIREVTDQNGNILGKVCSASTYGFGGDIVFTLGIDNDLVIKGFTVTSASNESPGLGAKCLEDGFSNQFIGKHEDIKLNDSTSNNQIDGISNATITSKAITFALNSIIEYFGSED